MPLSMPNKGESRKDFIARFMSKHKEEFPDIKQRLAVAFSQWRKHLKNKRKVKNSMRVIKEDHLAIAGRNIMGPKLFDYMFPVTSWMLTMLPAMARGAVLAEEVARTNPWFVYPTAISDNTLYDILYNPHAYLSTSGHHLWFER